jgi:hypothetical protein
VHTVGVFTDGHGRDLDGGVSGLDVCRRVGRASRCGRPASRTVSQGAAAGKAGALMSGLAAREFVTIARRAERARVARAFVGGVLGSGHPCGEVAVLLVSELTAGDGLSVCLRRITFGSRAISVRPKRADS